MGDLVVNDLVKLRHSRLFCIGLALLAGLIAHHEWRTLQANVSGCRSAFLALTGPDARLLTPVQRALLTSQQAYFGQALSANARLITAASSLASNVGALLAVYVGAGVVGLDLARGVLRTTLAVRPQRTAYVVSKIASTLIVWVACGLALAAILEVVGVVAQASSSAPCRAAPQGPGWPGPAVVALLGLPLLVAASYAMLTVAGLLVVRSALGGIGVVLFLILADMVLASSVPALRPYTISGLVWEAGRALDATIVGPRSWPVIFSGGLGPGAAAAILLGVVAALFVATVAVFRRLPL
ncbi:MAG: hypothetical protein ACYDAQ_01895 [Mycobacteriales bacterium]